MNTDTRFLKAAQIVLVAALAAVAINSFGQTIREDSSLVDRAEGATVVQRVKAGTSIKLVRRQGFWVQVEIAGSSGWIKASAVSFSAGGTGATAIDTGRLGQSNIVATSAARGLSAKDLLNGKPNFEDVSWLESLPSQVSVVPNFLSAGGVTAPAQRIQLTAVQQSAPQTSSPQTSGAGNRESKKKGDDDW